MNAFDVTPGEVTAFASGRIVEVSVVEVALGIGFVVLEVDCHGGESDA
jgi:hypothetical protein